MKKNIDSGSFLKIAWGRNFAIGVGLFLAIWACDREAAGRHVPSPLAEKVVHVTVTPSSVGLVVGQTQQFSVTIGDAAGNILPTRKAASSLVEGPSKQSTSTIGDSTGRKGHIVNWRSSQPDKVAVDDNGLARALAVGSSVISAASDGREHAAKVIVTEFQQDPVTVVPESASLPAGETLQLKLVPRNNKVGIPCGAIIWRSDQPSKAEVDSNGLLKAKAEGVATITATCGGRTGNAVVEIEKAISICGLDFPGNAGVNTTMRFEFSTPPAAYPATYIWCVYPRQQLSYYTAFFWGNKDAFYGSNTYYGFHPYPDWNTANQHSWEIAAPPGGDFVSPTHVVYDRWYIQVAVCRKSGSKTITEYYWDWPDTKKMVRHSGEEYDDPPVPVLVVGDAPWNHGNEVWDGVIRGFQFYDAALERSAIEREIAAPGTVRTPWYMNLNPTPEDISDKSGNGHHPAWVGGERPLLWTGVLNRGVIVRTAVVPR
jgi:Bacterial Ig-like domain (group 2)